MREKKKIITFRLNPVYIHWLRTAAEIEERTIVGVLESALNAYFAVKEPRTQTGNRISTNRNNDSVVSR